MKDAIDMSLRLGVRYIWIDALCILQDNKSDKNSQLQLMENLYKHAVITIVAVVETVHRSDYLGHVQGLVM